MRYFFHFIILFIFIFGWQSLYAQVNMSNGSSTTCSTDFFDSGGASDYSNNETLVYTFFPTIAGNKIRVDFSSFRTNDANDFLEIFDGNGVTGTLLTTMSGNLGNAITGTYVFTSTTADGSLTFRFTSDNSATRRGWAAAISCVAPPPLTMPTGGTTSSVTTCGTTLFDSGGNGGSTTTSGVAGNYINGSPTGDGTLTIFPATAGQFVRITFISFSTEATFDELEIFNGNSTAAIDLLHTFDGNGLPSPSVITSNAANGALTLRFDVDGSVDRAGFEIAISCFNPCPIAAGTATISTPSVCSGNPVTLNVTGQSGSVQWQQSINGGVTFTNIVGATNATRIVNPTVNTLYRVVISEATCVPTSATSNTVSVAITPCVNMPVGVPTSTTTCSTKLFDSGGSAGNYTNNGDGTFTIFPAIAGNLVRLTFISFATEACCDRLEVFNGNSTAAVDLIGTFAGVALPPVITSSAANGALTLRFDADFSNVNTGFEIDVSCFNPCPTVGGTASVLAASICAGQSTTLSLAGQNGQTIQWEQSTDGGATFNAIVGATSTTRVVSPTVNTVYRAISSATSCGSSPSSTVTVTINSCVITPPTGTTSITTCSSTLYDSGGSAGDYTNNEDGTVTIFPSTAGTKVRLTFSAFNTENTYDFLIVHNGNSVSAPQIGNFTGVAIPPVVTSTAIDGSLTVRFTSEGGGVRAGFVAAISCFDPCPTIGGTANISAAAICSGQSTTLSLAGQRGDIQWQQSTDGGTTFSNIVGATSTPRIVNPTVNTVYRAILSALNCASSTSSTVAVTINNCVVTPPTGTTSITTCSSTLFDSGGGTGNYGNNENGIVTIYPSTAGGKATLTFTTFATQAGSDILEVFSGNSTAGTLLGTFSGAALPPVLTSAAADGSLTVRFISNGSTVNTGWSANITCTCGFFITNLTISNCAGTSPTIYDLNMQFNAVSTPSANFQIYINGLLQTTQAYTANPQNLTLAGLVNNNSPVTIEIRDATDATCRLSRTLISAGTDRNVCGTSTTLNAQTATGGQWTVVSGPNTPTFSNSLNPNAAISGLVSGTYTLRWTSTISGGCTFNDEVILNVTANCSFDTSDPDASNICSATFTSHDTYPANYANNYNEVVTLCPEVGEALQITFNTINLAAGDQIRVWLSNTETATPNLTFTSADNGRSFTIKSQDASGCITIRFITDAATTSTGFTSTISCTKPDSPSAVNCLGAVPLCTDLTYAFPTGGGSTGTQNGGINLGCASLNNVKWFYLEMAETGNFTFSINPVVPANDYDFAIWGPFDSYGDIPCLGGDNAGMGAPIRCNYSVTGGATGLGANPLLNPSEGVGGPPFSSFLPVTAGKFYMLMVNDFNNRGNGFNITANTINGNNPTNCDIVDCDAFFGNQVFSSTGATNYGSSYICYDDAVTLGAVDNSFTLGGLTGEGFYFVHSNTPNTLFTSRPNFTTNNLATSSYVTSGLGGLANNQLTITNNGSAFAANQIWNIYATTGVAGVPDPSFVNSCSFWFPFEVKLLPQITATIPTTCSNDFSITNINGGLPRFQQDREGGATTNYTVELVNASNVVAYTRNVALGGNANFTGVAMGTYTVRITDQNGCPVSLGSISISKPAYDDFCTAQPVFTGNNGVFTNKCATIQVGETGGSCFTGVSNQVAQSIWTAFTPTLTGNYLVRIAQGTDATFPATGGLFDSELAIYTNSATCPALPVLTQLACNDDNAAAASVHSEIPTIAMSAGTTYFIQIDGKAFFAGGGGAYSGSSAADDIILYIEDLNPLPIELKKFYGYVKEEGNRIFWETAMEKDVAYFSLEASTDGIIFFEVNKQNANQKPYNYEFLHTEPQQKMYYRLKDVSTHGEVKYSNTIYLVRENPSSIQKGVLGVYPNPTLDNITIRMFYPNSKQVSLQLFDTKGVELINKTVKIPSSQVIENTLSLANLPAGVYILSLTTETGREVVKIVKQ